MKRFRATSVIFGLILIAIAIGIFWYGSYTVLNAKGARGGFGLFDWLFIFIPTMFMFGIIITIRGMFWGAKVWSGRNILLTGLVMLVIGAFPWFYTPWLMGTRGGDEGSGMMGTLIFLLVGIPGLLLTIIGLFFRGWESDR
ncbi:MAG: hypothetical protein QME64_07765 [bacterium]|nr:hypothetical protein [bacterium]